MDREFLKKAAAFFATENLEPERAFAVIEAEKATHSVVADGRTARGVPVGLLRLGGPPGRLAPGRGQQRRAELMVKIKVAHDASRVNGAPRILADLREAGEVVSRKTVAKLMRAATRSVGISPRPWRPVTTIAELEPARHRRTWSTAASTAAS